jgi:N-acetyl-anhydromuramyl-L-alanine amidase AmpD
MNHYIPQGDADRKAMPMARGLLDYFPAALAAVSSHSYLANRKHNPGEEINWARGKSNDHADCIMRHLIERGGVEEVELPDGQIILLRASAALAWRALALLQEELEAEGYAPGRASRWPDWPKEGQPEPASVLELNAG